MNSIGLYIHLPFCASKCGYCKFFSVEYDPTTADLYKSAVIRNVLSARESGLSFDTVFFGGGTPSLMCGAVAEILGNLRKPLSREFRAKILSGKETRRSKALCLARRVDKARRNFRRKSPKEGFRRVPPAVAPERGAEITVECNPGDVTADSLAVLRAAGVNRLSIGVQSLNDELLRRLGRRHDSAGAVRAVELARESGFANVSADIMLGIPGKTADDVRAVCELPVTHVSAYLYEARETMDEDSAADLYLAAVEIAEAAGLRQYEISNFALPGYECRHNLKYWLCGEYLGIGAAAHSYCGGSRFAVEEDIPAFIAAPIQRTYVTEPNPGTFEERAMLALRLTRGLRESDCAAAEWVRLCERAAGVPGEYLRVTKETLSLTAKGFLVANMVIGELLG